MPWTCPACSVRIRHNEIEPEPRVGVIYRCPICRLEFVLDPQTNKLQVAPLKDEQ